MVSATRRPLCIVQVDRGGALSVDDAELAELSEALDASGYERIAVICIAGALRQGKSFIMDLFARFLGRRGAQWLPPSLQGDERFHWRAGMDRCTQGVWAWPELFAAEDDTGTLGILLLDTQGMYEPGATRGQSTKLLGLACAMSSRLLFNVSKQLQEDTVEDLCVSLELLRMRCRQYGVECFDGDTGTGELSFLIRDWAHGPPPEDGEHPAAGELLATQEKQIVTNFVKKTISGRQLGSFFSDTDCWVLPHPGPIDRPSWGGHSADVAPDFVQRCETLFQHLAGKARPLAHARHEVPAADFAPELRRWVSILAAEQACPGPDSMSYTDAMRSSSALLAMERARSCYRVRMRVSGAMADDTDIVGLLTGETAARTLPVDDELTIAHVEARAAAEMELRSAAVFSSQGELDTLAVQLQNEFDEELPRLSAENERLNQQRFNGLAGAAVAAAAAAAVCPPLAPRIVAAVAPTVGLQLWRFQDAGGDLLANSVELHKEMIRTEREWAKTLQASVAREFSAPDAPAGGRDADGQPTAPAKSAD